MSIYRALYTNKVVLDNVLENHADSVSPFLDRSDTSAHPSLFIPFGRDTDFVNRGALLGQIHQKCSVPGSRTALVGLGGIG